MAFCADKMPEVCWNLVYLAWNFEGDFGRTHSDVEARCTGRGTLHARWGRRVVRADCYDRCILVLQRGAGVGPFHVSPLLIQVACKRNGLCTSGCPGFEPLLWNRLQTAAKAAVAWVHALGHSSCIVHLHSLYGPISVENYWPCLEAGVWRTSDRPGHSGWSRHSWLPKSSNGSALFGKWRGRYMPFCRPVYVKKPGFSCETPMETCSCLVPGACRLF